ncbi:hypothetical protein [Gimesia aquarii]|uniref:Glycosyltransferase RgtA/B/C/D-like domain-containing protein n=1 Tax=Gimesia aquarii TaxID=2527964 RepID=A0A517WW57_9PLAN|nr:hypothetical protein [Gimesia aquarii]QDU09494.1 hypothetical protein V202x_28690 [Gimesia aquarii]
MKGPDLEHVPGEWTMSDQEWWLSTAMIWGCCLFLTSTVTIADPDLWGHTLYGLRAIEQHVLVEYSDPFCYTEPGAIWVNHEWLSELSFGWLWSNYGNIGLWLWRNFWLLVIFISAWFALRKFKASLAAAILLLVYTAFCLSQFVVFVRPQLVTFGCFALTLLLLRHYLNHPQSKSIWYLPVVMLFWANSHGGFLAGVGIQGVVLLWMGKGVYQSQYQQRDFFRLCITIGLAWTVTLINPYGIQLHQMLWDHLITKQIVREWQPLWDAQQALLYYIPFLLIGLAFFGSRKWEWVDLILITVVAYQAVSHIRHVALLAIAVIILLPRPISDAIRRLFPYLNQQWGGEPRRKIRFLLVAFTMLMVSGLAVHTIIKLWEESVPPWEIGVETQSRAPGMPVATIEVMQDENLTGNILTDYGWAQYVIWQTFPESRIAFDGRYRTVYSAKLEEELIQFQKLDKNSRGPTPLLDQYPTEILLLPASLKVLGYLEQRQDWVQIYEDPQATLWVKKIPRFQEIIAETKQKKLAIPQVPKWCLFPADPKTLTHK